MNWETKEKSKITRESPSTRTHSIPEVFEKCVEVAPQPIIEIPLFKELFDKGLNLEFIWNGWKATDKPQRICPAEIPVNGLGLHKRRVGAHPKCGPEIFITEPDRADLFRQDNLLWNCTSFDLVFDRYTSCAPTTFHEDRFKQWQILPIPSHSFQDIHGSLSSSLFSRDTCKHEVFIGVFTTRLFIEIVEVFPAKILRLKVIQGVVFYRLSNRINFVNIVFEIVLNIDDVKNIVFVIWQLKAIFGLFQIIIAFKGKAQLSF